MNLNKLIKTHLLKRSAVSYALYPMGLLYGAIVQKLHRYHIKKAYHAPCKVISVGNLVCGGSGKTPLTIALARLLQEKGYNVAVSHRGYKGMFEHIPTLISNSKGILFDAQQTGDEAYQIASALPKIPVVVGRKRKQAIRLLLKSYPATDVVILDDAFQHARVFRDLDIVTFSAEIGLGNGFVLPSGYLREPLSALGKDCLAVVYRARFNCGNAILVNKLQKTGCPIFGSYSTVTLCQDARGYTFPVESLKGKRLVLVSGIAHPESFEAKVTELGLAFSRHFAFQDHYAFASETVVDELNQEMPEIILCTQKDIMKLARYNEIKNRLRALILDYCFDDKDGFIKSVQHEIALQ